MANRKSVDEMVVWGQADEIIDVIAFVIPLGFFNFIDWNVEVVPLLRENEDEIGCLAFAIKDEGVTGLDAGSAAVLSARAFPGFEG